MIRAGAQRDSGAQRYGDPGAERVRPSAAAGGAQRYGSQRRAALMAALHTAGRGGDGLAKSRS